MHAYANPTRFLAIARPLTPWLLGLGLALLLAGAWAGLMLVPGDYKQGDTARILYIHVPSAWLGMGGWTGLAVAGLVQLVWRHPLAGRSEEHTSELQSLMRITYAVYWLTQKTTQTSSVYFTNIFEAN